MKWNAVNVMMVFFVVIMLGLAGCGGGGGDQNATQTPPTISSLQYTPATLTVNTLTSVNWQFDYTDTGGDISTGTYTVINPSGVQVFAKTINLTIPAGRNTGTQFGTTSNVTFITVGTYTVNMYVTDSAGANSNTLTATFTIIP
jgi:hypothetical protein